MHIYVQIVFSFSSVFPPKKTVEHQPCQVFTENLTHTVSASPSYISHVLLASNLSFTPYSIGNLIISVVMISS